MSEARNPVAGRLLGATLVAILAVGILSRLLNLGSAGIYIDETWVVPTTNFHFESNDIFPKLFEEEGFRNLPERARKLIRTVYDFHPLVQVAVIRAASDVHPPLYFFPNYYWGRWFGYRMEVVRFPAALYFVAALFLLLHILRREGVRTPQVVAILLFVVVSPIYLLLSVYARPYTLMLLLGLWSSYLAYRAVREEFRTRTVVLYVLATTALMYTHYYGILLSLSQALYLVVESALGRQLRKRFTTIAIAEAAVALLYLPWAFALLFQMRMRYARLETNQGFNGFDIRALADLLLHFGLGYSRATITSPLNIASTVLMVVLCGFGVAHLLKSRSHPLSRFWLFFLFVPLTAIILLNTVNPVFTPRNCTIVLIPYLAICGYGLASMKNRWARAGAAAAVVVVGGFSIFGGMARANASWEGDVEDWRSIAAHVKASRESKPVYVFHSSYRDALYYYVPDASLIRGLGDEMTSNGPGDKEFTLVVVNPRKVPMEEKLRELAFLFDGSHGWTFRYRAAGISVYDVRAEAMAGPAFPIPGIGAGEPTP